MLYDDIYFNESIISQNINGERFMWMEEYMGKIMPIEK